MKSLPKKKATSKELFDWTADAERARARTLGLELERDGGEWTLTDSLGGVSERGTFMDMVELLDELAEELGR